MRDSLEEFLGLEGDAGAELAPARSPMRSAIPIDYAKGKAPSRQALVAAAAEIDAEAGIPGYAAGSAAKALWLKAMNGDGNAWRDISDRLDGKPAQVTEGAGTILPLHIMPIEQLRALVAEHTGQTYEAEPSKPLPWHKRQG